MSSRVFHRNNPFEVFLILSSLFWSFARVFETLPTRQVKSIYDSHLDGITEAFCVQSHAFVKSDGDALVQSQVQTSNENRLAQIAADGVLLFLKGTTGGVPAQFAPRPFYYRIGIDSLEDSVQVSWSH